MNRPVEDILPDQRREGSVRLMSGGRTLLSVPADAVASERIAVGTLVGADQMERLESAADRAAAYRTALRLLERRPYGRVDLGRRLRLKGHSPEALAFALERAEQAGFLDDAKFAAHYVQSRSARGRGPSRLRRELQGMGVEKATVDQALGPELTDPEAVHERVRLLIAKRLPQVQGRPDAEARRRLLAFLARRGFAGLEIGRLVREAVRGVG